ncbi:hypothetical protein PAMA_021629 [Pampus argenteus]
MLEYPVMIGCHPVFATVFHCASKCHARFSPLNHRELKCIFTNPYLVLLLQNLTRSFNTSKERDPCPSGKAHRILGSIYSMTQQTRCQRNGKRQPDLEKPLERMEQLIIHNCSPDYLGKKATCSAVQKIRGARRKRNRLIKVIKALVTCWQKLQSIYMLTK